MSPEENWAFLPALDFLHIIDVLRAPKVLVIFMLCMEKDQCLKLPHTIGFLRLKNGKLRPKDESNAIRPFEFDEDWWNYFSTKIQVKRPENSWSRSVVMKSLWPVILTQWERFKNMEVGCHTILNATHDSWSRIWSVVSTAILSRYGAVGFPFLAIDFERSAWCINQWWCGIEFDWTNYMNQYRENTISEASKDFLKDGRKS